MKTYVLLLFLASISIAGYARQKEIFIIGTMHTVPKIVKHSYKPLLKLAIKYNPEAIYVERPMPDDTISWEYLKNGWSDAYRQFYFLSDSLRKHASTGHYKIKNLLSGKAAELGADDLDLLIRYFAYSRDYSNYEFYKYIKKFGTPGSPKPLRNENQDLTFKLALRLGINKLKNMDDQQTNEEYHEAWSACVKLGAANGDNLLNKKINKQDYNRSLLPALLGRLGKHTNTISALNRMHSLNSFRYVANASESANLATRFWDERNERMAKNIVKQMNNSSAVKNLVVVGAGHVIGLKEALERLDPSVIVKLIYK